MKLKKVQKLILYEVAPLFFMLNLFFIFLLLLEQLVELAELVFVKGVPSGIMLETIIFYMPSFMVITIPISILLAVLLAFSKFSADSELVAMTVCGASLKTIATPVLIIGLITTMFNVYLNISLLPKGSALAVRNINKMLENISLNDIRERELYTDIDGMLFYANKKLGDGNFENILMIDNGRNVVVSAKHGTIVPNASHSIAMRFSDGRMTLADSDTHSYSNITFDGMLVNYPLNIRAKLLPQNHKIMTLTQLKERFSGGAVFKYEYMKRFSMPLTSIIMALLGLSMTSFNSRSSRSLKILLACIVGFSLNILFVLAENLVNIINPFVLAWLPLLLYGAITAVLLRRIYV
ncbi:hypothetical protein RsTz2092_12050 [Deferribacterales bacterium RsTz2092]|nr:hypothetical protein AGMMS49941_11100 [Deferribacterales bacterium]